MFRLKNITLVQFRNYEGRNFPFSQRIVGIAGNNGLGKTNLLDAIYYLCFTRSYFTRSDQLLVRHGHEGFRLQGVFELNGRDTEALCVLREGAGARKEFSVDGEEYDRLSAHIGKFPCVMVVPDDAQIITGPAEERRRFIDSLLSQTDAQYLRSLIEYNRILLQRNSLLKSIAERRESNRALLDVYDEQMAAAGLLVYRKRSSCLKELMPAIRERYETIVGENPGLTLTYQSQLQEGEFLELLAASRQKDILSQRSLCGIHRDNIEISLNDQPFRWLASQGQRKSLLFSLKLAEFDWLEKAKGFSPILLLDDVFEKLDAERMDKLLERVCVRNRGQVFITDTHAERIREKFAALGEPFQLIELGKISAQSGYI